MEHFITILNSLLLKKVFEKAGSAKINSNIILKTKNKA